MAELILTIDASEIIKAYKKGFEDCFTLMVDDNELQSELNINKIDNAEGISG